MAKRKRKRKGRKGKGQPQDQPAAGSSSSEASAAEANGSAAPAEPAGSAGSAAPEEPAAAPELDTPSSTTAPELDTPSSAAAPELDTPSSAAAPELDATSTPEEGVGAPVEGVAEPVVGVAEVIGGPVESGADEPDTKGDLTCAACSIIVPTGDAEPCTACGANHHAKCRRAADGACARCGAKSVTEVPVEGSLPERAVRAFAEEFGRTGSVLMLLVLLTGLVYVNSILVPFLFDDAPVITRNTLLWSWANWKDLILRLPTRCLVNLTFLLNFQLAHSPPPTGLLVTGILSIVVGIGAFLVQFLRLGGKPPEGKTLYVTVGMIPLGIALIVAAKVWVGEGSFGAIVPLRPFSLRDYASYHVVSIVCHAINAVLAFLLVRDLLKARPGEVPAGMVQWVALAGTAVWVVHPMNTMAVSYISQRFALMGAMAFLGTLTLYTRLRLRLQLTDDPLEKHWKLLVGALLCAIACGMTKPNVVVVPVVIVLIEVFFFNGRRLGVAGIFVGLYVGLALLALTVLGGDGFLTRFFPERSPTANREEYFITQIVVVLRYIHLFLLPHDLSAEQAFPVLWKSERPNPAPGGEPFPGGWNEEWWLVKDPIQGIVWDGVGGMVVLAILGHLLLWFLAVKLFARGHRMIPLAIVWFYVTNLVESSIVPILDPMVDHRMYLPTILFAPALAVAVARSWTVLSARWPQAKTAIPIGAAGIVLALGAGTIARNYVWSSATGIWADTLEKRPWCARAYSSLGMEYLYEGQWNLAIGPIELALQLGPGHVEGWNNLGKAYLELNKLERARVALIRGIQVNTMHPSPSVVMCENNLGLVLIRLASRKGVPRERRKQMLAQASHHLANAVQRDTMYEIAYLNRATAEFELMNLAQANSDERRGHAREVVISVSNAEAVSRARKGGPLQVQQARWRAIALTEWGDPQRTAEGISQLNQLAGYETTFKQRLANDLGEAAAAAANRKDPQAALFLKVAEERLSQEITARGKAAAGALFLTHGLVLDKQGRFKAAVQQMKEGLRRFPTHPLRVGILRRIQQIERGDTGASPDGPTPPPKESGPLPPPKESGPPPPPK